jgi:hypothetical protein
MDQKLASTALVSSPYACAFLCIASRGYKYLL